MEQPPGYIKPELNEPNKVIEIYLKAVSRGELIIFDRKLDTSMIIPRRIEYVYELNSSVLKVKIYAELTQPIPVPGVESCEIRAVSSILDADGHIIETKAHIWTK